MPPRAVLARICRTAAGAGDATMTSPLEHWERQEIMRREGFDADQALASHLAMQAWHGLHTRASFADLVQARSKMTDAMKLLDAVIERVSDARVASELNRKPEKNQATVS